MTYVQWNLDPFEEKEIAIYQISILSEALEERKSNNVKRLLVLSHSLGIQKIPSFFLQNSPNYSPFPVNQSVLIVFDFFHKFDIKEQSLNWCSFFSWKYDIHQPFDATFYNDLQCALNVVSYYEFEKLSPIYFTSFLLFPQSDSFPDPFLYQKVPIRSKFSLSIRTHIQKCSQFIIDYPDPLLPGNYVLISPYDHPFLVISSADKFITVKSVDDITMTFDVATTLFVLITNPSIFLPNFVLSGSTPLFRSSYRQKSQNHTENYFYPVQFFEYSKSDQIGILLIPRPTDHDFLHSEDDSPNTAILEYPDLTLDQILSQIVKDKSNRKIILKCLGKGELPSHRLTLILPIAQSIAFTNNEFCFTNCRIPFHVKGLLTTNSIRYEKLSIPKLLVQIKNQRKPVPATTIITQWKSERFYPICGQKNAHFVVFSVSTISKCLIHTFFASFCNSYTLFNFGSLSPLPNEETYIFLSYEDMPVVIKTYIDQQKLIEFRQFPLIIFIVGPRIHDPEFNPHALISYIDPNFIQAAKTNEIESLVFDLYSTIRIYKPFPFGMTEPLNKLPLKLFFGYRYQPPVYLDREDKNLMNVHIAWDEVTQTASFVDEIGSVFDVVPNISIANMNTIINDIKKMFKEIPVKFTLSILSEGITQKLNQEIHQKIDPEILKNILLFAISPQPNIQCLFDENFDEDVLIFAPTEQFMQSTDGTEFLIPLCSCYVVSNFLHAYSISFYSNQMVISAAPQRHVYQFAHQMSNLSWLSIKPKCEKRTISYPPHISALLKKTNAPVKRIAKYEFVPSSECL